MQIIHLRETDSTNTFLKTAAKDGLAHLTAVYADRQTAGRGRVGRSFWSPEGGLYASLFLSLDEIRVPFELLTPFSAVSVLRALDGFIGERAGIKWVNDLYIGSEKIAGILCETVGDPETGAITGAVVGVGVNLSETKFPEELNGIASSVFRKTGVGIAPEKLLEAILAQFSDEKNAGDFMNTYRERSMLIGRKVRVVTANGEYDAVCRAIDDKAHLHVRTQNGDEKELVSGEVRLRLS